MQITSKILVGVAMLALAGCGSTNTKGSWACAADRGVPCSSIATLDGQSGAAGAMTARHDGKVAPLVDGAGALRWWTAAEAGGGAFDQAPRREPDQFAKVLIGGWIDGSGDYHAPSQVFALMRRGGWWAAPPAVPLVTAQSGERTPTPRLAGPAPVSSVSTVANPPVAQPENLAAASGAGSKKDAAGPVAARAAPAVVATAKPAGS